MTKTLNYGNKLEELTIPYLPTLFPFPKLLSHPDRQPQCPGFQESEAASEMAALSRSPQVVLEFSQPEKGDNENHRHQYLTGFDINPS
ncbi:hypothetical protein [Lyngbya sp. CCY1209]|uniref:hypothetical protein n=1 Tax=Lyngbya sp. CCY1209 TaxID=2886103 RepID=UPI002D204B2C|nr:hypothetical protein [Lyngbya sp. CCY1209]MEB3882626.1 hypothetical protein [Lyngbya sp. CCY1209]